MNLPELNTLGEHVEVWRCNVADVTTANKKTTRNIER